MLRVTLLLTWVIAMSGTLAMAQELKISIEKQPDAPPRVEALAVDLIGAERLRTLLGEDFLVVSKNNAGAGRGFDDDDPIDWPVTDPIPPVVPECFCPEDYGLRLTERWIQMDRNGGWAGLREIFEYPNAAPSTPQDTSGSPRVTNGLAEGLLREFQRGNMVVGPSLLDR